MTTLVAVLAAHAKDPTQAARPAIESHPGGAVLTYADLWARAGAVARTLPSVTNGYLAFRVQDPAQLPVAMLASWLRGLALFPLAPRLTGREERALLEQAGAPTAVWDTLPSISPGESVPPPPSLSGPALLLATSGSTSAPRVFSFRHPELLAAARVEARHAPYADGGAIRVLNLRPAFTSGGTNTLWPAFLRGDTLCYAAPGVHALPRHEAWDELLRRAKPDLVVASPAYLRALVAEGAIPAANPGTLLYYGGTRLRPSEHDALWRAGLRTFMRYGMTECAHLLAMKAVTRATLDEAPGPVGRLFAEVTVRTDQDTLSFLAPGFAHYQRESGRDVTCLDKDGWYHTDDHGRLRSDGELLVEGRDHRQLVVNGFRVAAAEIEEAAIATGLALDAAALATADGVSGQKVVLLAVPKPGAERENLLTRLRESLSSHKLPAQIQWAAAIPVTPNGKRHWRRIHALFPAPPLAPWPAHFELWRRLRKHAKWRARPWLAKLAVAYQSCLRERLPEAEIANVLLLLEEAARQPGKHTGYQVVWGWNALAYQQYRFQNRPIEAQASLLKALRLFAQKVPGRSQNSQAESAWLFLFLNLARLRLRTHQKTEGDARLRALENYLRGDPLEASVFGEEASEIYNDGSLFPRHPELAQFAREKISEERDRWLGGGSERQNAGYFRKT